MLKGWGRKNSINVQKVLWCCDELGTSRERVDAGGASGFTRDPGYLALDPNGLVLNISDAQYGSYWRRYSPLRT